MKYEDIIRVLNKEKVDYLVTGGVAVVLHGAIRFTADIDLILNLDVTNLKKFLDAMKSIGYRPRIPVSEKDILDTKKREQWITEKNMIALSFYHPKDPIILVDILIDTKNLPADYSKLKLDSVQRKIGNLRMNILSIDAILEMKKSAGREQDKADVKALTEIKKLAKNKAKQK